MSSTANDAFTHWLRGGELPARELIGGKAWSLARMSSLGLRVPPAFVVTTDGFRRYDAEGELTADLREQIIEGVARLERETERTFGRSPRPLLLSVRSGAPISMPGMMDTVLNLGMTDDVEASLAEESGDPVFARDTHRRFLDLYTDIVLNLDPRDHSGALPGEVRASVSAAAPQAAWNPAGQLLAAVEAVFRSWNSRRARRYRSHQGIADDLGTAVTIQAMVFGNLGENSGTGVLFSRNPLSGSNEVYGEYLRRAQGEDVVSGRVTPQPLSELADQDPALHAELLSAAQQLESENAEVQDVEFTVQRGTLYLLQSRTAKLAPAAALHTSIALVEEGLLDLESAVRRLSPSQARSLVAPRLATLDRDIATLATGESACAGVGAGVVVDDPDRAVELAADGVAVILARPTTSPDDLAGMLASTGLVTEEGGSTSHAAVVSRALGIPCVVGCGPGSLVGFAGRSVTVDGGAGSVYAGELPVAVPREEDSAELRTMIDWARTLSPIEVTPDQDGVADDEIVDLETIPGGNDPEQAPDVVRGLVSPVGLRGGAVAASQVVEAAIESGVTRIVADPVLPILLAAIHHSRPAPDDQQSPANLTTVPNTKGAPQ